MKKSFAAMLTGLIILCVLGWYIDRAAHKEITQAIKFTIYVVASLAIFSLVAVFVTAILFVRERILTERATRKLAQREATIMVVRADEGQQVYIRDTDTKAVWRNAHLDSKVYANGQQVTPSKIELTAWQTWTLRNRPNAIKEITPQLLPATAAQVDLLTALDNVQRCLIVGPSDSGKTTLLQWIVKRRLQTSKVVVIDPHSWPDKWAGCTVAGTGRNYAEIDRALAALIQIMTKRYNEIGEGLIGEGSHPKLSILIDEWRAIVFNVKGASEAIKALLTESRKAAFSVFVATHSERVRALGIEGEGDLKDGFAVVRLSIMDGQRLATLDKGTGEIPVILPPKFDVATAQIMETSDYSNLEVEPTPAEGHILNLYEQGESFNEIARQVFGHTGGKQTERIKQVISRFN